MTVTVVRKQKNALAVASSPFLKPDVGHLLALLEPYNAAPFTGQPNVLDRTRNSCMSSCTFRQTVFF